MTTIIKIILAFIAGMFALNLLGALAGMVSQLLTSPIAALGVFLLAAAMLRRN